MGTRGARRVPRREAHLYESLAEVAPLLALFELQRSLYELRYELANRPDWASIPLAALRELLEHESSP